MGLLNFRLMILLTVVGLSGLLACAGGNANAESPPMNVLFILADDLGWRDLSNEGSTFYESPHIDRIANTGMKFTRGYAACQVCSPSRASILTGKYPARLKITDWIGADMGDQWQRNTKLRPANYRMQLPQQETTIAEAFQQSGYRTFFAGKWHLGGKGSLPQDHGFDVNVGGNHRGSPPGGYFSPYRNANLPNGPRGELLPLRLGHETADWIAADQDQPFFAMLSFYSVHGPLQSTEALWKKYRDKAALQSRPENRFLIDRTSPVRQVQDNPLYAGMVESMDDAVGIVLDRIDQLGLAENTIVVFTSDNGGVSAGDCKSTSNLPLRGGKGRQWEGGIREPIYIVVPGGRSGVTDTLAIGTDFYPTLLDLCGLDLRPDQHVDGMSLAPILFRDDRFAKKEIGRDEGSGDEVTNADADSVEAKTETLQRRSLFWHYPHYGNQGGEPSSMIRRGDWKLIFYYEDRRMELYNVANDIGETNNVAADVPDLTASLREELDNWLRETEAQLPTVNPDFDPEEAEQHKIKVRQIELPKLERQHADFLLPDFEPDNGWWEATGK